jgi:hypothetical protein
MCIEELCPYPGCILYDSMENKYDDDDDNKEHIAPSQ